MLSYARAVTRTVGRSRQDMQLGAMHARTRRLERRPLCVVPPVVFSGLPAGIVCGVCSSPLCCWSRKPSWRGRGSSTGAGGPSGRRGTLRLPRQRNSAASCAARAAASSAACVTSIYSCIQGVDRMWQRSRKGPPRYSCELHTHVHVSSAVSQTILHTELAVVLNKHCVSIVRNNVFLNRKGETEHKPLQTRQTSNLEVK